MGILEIVSSLFGGGLTGLIGSVISNVFTWKTKKLEIEQQKQKFEYDITMKRVDSELMAQEWAAKTKMAETEAKGHEAVEDAKAFAASFNEPIRYSDQVKPTTGQGWMFIALDTVRGLVRPGLTIYLCVLTTLLYSDAHKLLRADDFTQTQAEVLVTKIVSMILYLTTTCVLWWFGTRSRQTAPNV